MSLKMATYIIFLGIIMIFLTPKPLLLKMSRKSRLSKPKDFSQAVSISGEGAAITADGSLYLLETRQVPSDSDIPQFVDVFTKVEGLSHVVSADAWGDSGIAATADGSVYVWGDVYMGDDKNWNPIVKTFQAPQKVEGLSDVASVGCGSSIFAAVTNTGDLYTWGMGPYGETGYGEGQPKSSAVPQKNFWKMWLLWSATNTQLPPSPAKGIFMSGAATLSTTPSGWTSPGLSTCCSPPF